MVGAAAIVANPVVLPPTDIAVSPAEYAANANGLDVLDPRFLESIGKNRPGWQTSVEVLEHLIYELVGPDGGVDLTALASDLAHTIDDGDPARLMSTLAAGASNELPAGAPGDGVIDHVSNPLGPGLWRSLHSRWCHEDRCGPRRHRAWLRRSRSQVRPTGRDGACLVAKLSEQVLTGTMEPGEALVRLLTAPLTALIGRPGLTGNPEIDAIYASGVMQPVIDAFVDNLSGTHQLG